MISPRTPITCTCNAPSPSLAGSERRVGQQRNAFRRGALRNWLVCRHRIAGWRIGRRRITGRRIGRRGVAGSGWRLRGVGRGAILAPPVPARAPNPAERQPGPNENRGGANSRTHRSNRSALVRFGPAETRSIGSDSEQTIAANDRVNFTARDSRSHPNGGHAERAKALSQGCPEDQSDENADQVAEIGRVEILKLPPCHKGKLNKLWLGARDEGPGRRGEGMADA